MRLLLLTALAALAFAAGFDAAKHRYLAQLAQHQAAYAQAQTQAANHYQTQLAQQLATSRKAEQGFIAQQQQLKHQHQQLKSQLHEATTATPACQLSPSWVRYYQAALGVPTATTATPTHTPAATATAATTTALLHHATAYGNWCTSNTQQLMALQQLLNQLTQEEKAP